MRSTFGVILGLTFGMCALARAEGGVTDFAAQSAQKDTFVTGIERSMVAADSLAADGQKSGTPLDQQACIAQKVASLRTIVGAAKTVREGWPLGEHSTSYADRSLHRLQTLSVAAEAYLADAKACAGTQLSRSSNKVTNASRYIPESPESLTTTTPTRLERPPLRSPF